MNTDEMIAVIQAYKDGADIECSQGSNNDWHLSSDPYWNFGTTCYRVKPKKPKTVFIGETPEGCVVFNHDIRMYRDDAARYIELTPEVRALVGGLVDEK